LHAVYDFAGYAILHFATLWKMHTTQTSTVGSLQHAPTGGQTASVLAVLDPIAFDWLPVASAAMLPFADSAILVSLFSFCLSPTACCVPTALACTLDAFSASGRALSVQLQHDVRGINRCGKLGWLITYTTWFHWNWSNNFMVDPSERCVSTAVATTLAATPVHPCRVSHFTPKAGECAFAAMVPQKKANGMVITSKTIVEMHQLCTAHSTSSTSQHLFSASSVVHQSDTNCIMTSSSFPVSFKAGRKLLPLRILASSQPKHRRSIKDATCSWHTRSPQTTSSLANRETLTVYCWRRCRLALHRRQLRRRVTCLRWVRGPGLRSVTGPGLRWITGPGLLRARRGFEWTREHNNEILGDRRKHGLNS
jgi:hypothetical protein